MQEFDGEIVLAGVRVEGVGECVGVAVQNEEETVFPRYEEFECVEGLV